ncbi:unnamed protein product [Microthlaspi erraticum]|uniref:Phytocyanin domain-containing protein n=1 Tax=Microthlaspi erraticum TaxID=1685480 RepID=A0A6D2JPA8_9BRAS|nr:unnamed protein product [Microthlaspi erraticum]
MMSFTVLMGSGCSAKSTKSETPMDGPRGRTYYEWAEHKEFHVGDSLIFKYDRNVSDVTQVSDAQEYEFCNSSSPKAVYNTGHDIRLHVLVVRGWSHPSLPRKILPLGKTTRSVIPTNGVFPKRVTSITSGVRRNKFHVGDNLLFYYNDQVNDVLEVSSDLEFNILRPSSPVAMHNTGQDLIKLTKPGIQYFISSKTGQCEAGLKLRVVVRPLFRALPRTRRMRSSPLDRSSSGYTDSDPNPITKHSFFFFCLVFD